MNNSPITIIGNLTRDPELRYTTGGRGVASVGVAVNHRYMKNDEWVEDVSFFNVTAWADLGENLAASMTKGQRVIVSGRMTQRSYETKDGETRSTMEVLADEIGAALRFATVIVERTERKDASSSQPSRSSRQPRQADPVYGEDEPF